LASGSSSGEENLEKIQKSFIFDLAKHQFHAALVVGLPPSETDLFSSQLEKLCLIQSIKMVVEKGSRVSLIATGNDGPNLQTFRYLSSP
jgi:hypothetical protein